MKLSVVLSVHNRSKLLGRALDGFVRQTLPPEEWEVLIVDDMSTEDLSESYRHLLGRMNLTHVKMDHTRHPVFLERNPSWEGGDPFENWFHTPALSTNLGIAMARGRILCLCHPEILHAPTNFERAVRMLEPKDEYLFGWTFLGTQETNRILDGLPDGTLSGWDGLLEAVKAGTLHSFSESELYWYTSFLPRRVAVEVGGVDFAYLHGVAGEDDDFRDRVAIAGCPPRMTRELQGLHQDHSDEKERHRLRDTPEWTSALARNRALLGERRGKRAFPRRANAEMDWTAQECLVSYQKFGLLTADSPAGRGGQAR